MIVASTRRRAGRRRRSRRGASSGSPWSSRRAGRPGRPSASRSARMPCSPARPPSESALGGPGAVGARAAGALHRRAQRARAVARARRPSRWRVDGEHFTRRRVRRRRPRGSRSRERYTSLVPAQLARLLDDPTPRATPCAASTRVLVGGQATPAPLARPRAGGGPPGRPHLRLERDERAAASTTACRSATTRGAHRRRRGAARRAERSPRATSATRR